jgi:hypothetical protein
VITCSYFSGSSLYFSMYNVLNYVNFNLHFTNVRIVVILLVISENIASCVSLYFRTSIFEKVL